MVIANWEAFVGEASDEQAEEQRGRDAKPGVFFKGKPVMSSINNGFGMVFAACSFSERGMRCHSDVGFWCLFYLVFGLSF